MENFRKQNINFLAYNNIFDNFLPFRGLKPIDEKLNEKELLKNNHVIIRCEKHNNVIYLVIFILSVDADLFKSQQLLKLFSGIPELKQSSSKRSNPIHTFIVYHKEFSKHIDGVIPKISDNESVNYIRHTPIIKQCFICNILDSEFIKSIRVLSEEEIDELYSNLSIDEHNKLSLPIILKNDPVALMHKLDENNVIEYNGYYRICK